jgi:ketosteroid isomerase-like protein
MSSSGIQKTAEAQVRELIENWAGAVRAQDLDGILKHHALDIVMFDVPPPVQSKGIDAYRKTWDVFYRWFGDAGVFDLSELTITAGEDVAFAHGLIRCAGGDANELAVRLTVGCRKIDGQWTVTHEHHSEPSSD